MKEFMGEDFLLSNDTAKKLYNDYAKDMPIFDYHCHLIPEQIAKDIKYNNITEIWLYGDHYKWRAMRSYGIDEKYIDQKDGMIRQMTALSQLGLISKFVGRLTDSRSFLSYTRQEYFRRILCNYLGEIVENGGHPADMEVLGDVVQDICFNNANKYFR